MDNWGRGEGGVSTPRKLVVEVHGSPQHGGYVTVASYREYKTVLLLMVPLMLSKLLPCGSLLGLCQRQTCSNVIVFCPYLV